MLCLIVVTHNFQMVENDLNIAGLVIRVESLVVQRTTKFSKCGCPPDFLVVHMHLLRAAPNPGKSDILSSID